MFCLFSKKISTSLSCGGSWYRSCLILCFSPGLLTYGTLSSGRQAKYIWTWRWRHVNGILSNHWQIVFFKRKQKTRSFSSFFYSGEGYQWRMTAHTATLLFFCDTPSQTCQPLSSHRRPTVKSLHIKGRQQRDCKC